MTRTQIINYIISKNNYNNYLEIGIQTKDSNYDFIIAKNKIGVDPWPDAKADFVMTSDDFFKINSEMFDIIFIDGLHERDQFIRDLENSLKVLKDGGTIVCHDCLPNSYEAQVVPRIQSEWTGDVWKGVAHFRMTREDICIEVVNTDYGCGIVRKGSQNVYIKNDNDELNYEYFVKNRNNLMNVISVQEFLKKY